MKKLKKEDILNEFIATYQAGIVEGKSPCSDLEIVAQTLKISDEIQIPASHKAVIGWQEQDLSHGYIESFYKIANLGVRKMETGFEDYYIYSIMYNYRHFIELSLKELLLSFRLSFGMNLHNTNKNNHNLSDLATELDNIVKSLELEELFPEAIINAIEEFHELDERNNSFRYSHHTDGTTYFDYNAKYFDLNKILQGMSILYEWFNSIAILFYEGLLSTPYTKSPSYKTFSLIAADKLINKSSNQIENLLRNIKFYYGIKNEENNSEENTNFIYFDLSTLKDKDCVETKSQNFEYMTISTNEGLKYNLECNMDENKIKSFYTLTEIISIYND